MDPTEGQGGLIIKGHINVNDLLIRRQKNRERQRRYRARKRLEADKKSLVLKQPNVPQLEVQPKEIPTSGVTRVYCKRNWKKDARLAHMRKFQEEMLSASIQSVPLPTTESQPLYLTSSTGMEQSAERKCGPENSFALAYSGMNKTKVGRRNWKADARNKKS